MYCECCGMTLPYRLRYGYNKICPDPGACVYRAHIIDRTSGAPGMFIWRVVTHYILMERE